ncbi:MAG: single-stranded DNA-binding protein [Acidobacteriota bacterium]|nr:single-stranded DNA-binding protein [Acidobacteriota bacterium]
MPDNAITVVGNVTRDPELKFLNSGQAAVRISVAVNRRWQNRQTQEWEERVSYFEVAGYGQMAENAANSISKGTRVIVTGRLEQRSWETEAGEKRSIVEINADEIAPSLRFATAVVTKTPRPEGSSFGAERAAAPRANEPAATYNFDEEPF